MREAIGTTWVYMIVLFFTLIFTGFIVLAISYSKSYKLKNEIALIIEKYEGITVYKEESPKSNSLKIINQYLQNSNYTIKRTCPPDDESYKYYGIKDLNNYETLEEVKQNEKYYYCVAFNKDSCTFKITLFYQINLPIIGNISKFTVSGETNPIKNIYILNKTYCN